MRRFLLLFLVACGGSSSSSNTNGTQQSALVVQTTNGQPTNIAAPGGTLALGAYVNQSGPYGGTTLELVNATWSSSNTAVATVDAKGVVSAVASGTSVITAKFGASTGQVTVTVGSAPAAVTIDWNLGAETAPVTTTVAAGTPVQWHASDTSHSIVPDTTPPPDSVSVPAGSTTAPQTITAKGTYHYHCGIHPTMTGTLVVQ